MLYYNYIILYYIIYYSPLGTKYFTFFTVYARCERLQIQYSSFIRADVLAEPPCEELHST